MPSMTEIYNRHAFEYDELVSHEDYSGNLPRKLHAIFNFNNKSVIEFGVGTGRLTKLYIQQVKQVSCFDRSVHMLDKAKANLEPFKGKTTLDICDNNYINRLDLKADFIIEGWSFGHTIMENADEVFKTTDKLVSDCALLLEKNGTIIIIETLGTDMEKPIPPAKTLEVFYNYLEEKHNFKRIIIETDYKFTTVHEAVRVLGFFFGEETAKSISEKNNTIVKEFTGIWYRKF
ncbi:MAG: class I SAM-dependent methyltransferase [Spirochaetes bacterium]|nr:class I SAM-dependent methyltransferase [Spirochaetota bacterium]